jgi:hypothetical protein
MKEIKKPLRDDSLKKEIKRLKKLLKPDADPQRIEELNAVLNCITDILNQPGRIPSRDLVRLMAILAPFCLGAKPVI